MKTTKLKIGKIPYTNLFPIYYYLENISARPEFVFLEGVPSELNRMLREGKIDVSPSSSIEYLKHKDIYSLIPWTSISAQGAVGSIYLFSRSPIESLGNSKIAVSSHSETSVVLLKIIMNEFLSLDCSYEITEASSVDKNLKQYSASLLIGDEAMREAKKLSAISNQPSEKNKAIAKNSLQITNHESPYLYDLGAIWHKHTGLPFVFALWIIRKESLAGKKELLKNLSEDIILAKKYIPKHLKTLAGKSPMRKWLSEKELVSYWNGISYDFTDEHMEGLLLFEKYAKNL
ncbi:MAG: menaquinone biosynthesis protein [Nitrospirae bacterium]|nr:menaquinone biosynthesis protein [Nitrospirota bacterium]